MDLYGSSQSISLRGSADSATANANSANKQFNRTILSERDEIKSAADEQLADYEALSTGKVGVQSARLGTLGVSTYADIQKASKVAKAGLIPDTVPLRVGMGSFGDVGSDLSDVGSAQRTAGGGVALENIGRSTRGASVGGAAEGVAQDASIAGEVAEDVGLAGKIAGKLAIGVRMGS